MKHKSFVRPVNGEIARYSIVKYALRELLKKYGYDGEIVDPDMELRARKLRRVL